MPTTHAPDPTTRPQEAAAGSPATVRISEILAALSCALDITEGQPEGHALRSCLIGMRIARAIGLPERECGPLYFALLLKDLGCSSNSAKIHSLFDADDRVVKSRLKTVDWTRFGEAFRYVRGNVSPRASALKKLATIVKISRGGSGGSKEMFRLRCDRGAEITRVLGLPEETARAIRALDEHWNGKGEPAGLKGERIPLSGRILGLAQTVEVFYSAHGRRRAYAMARARRGTWFDPSLVTALETFEEDAEFWLGLRDGDVLTEAESIAPPYSDAVVDTQRLEQIGLAFAMVVDAKSPWTYRHSEGVAQIAVGVGETLSLPGDDLHRLRLAALLHDIGKLGIPNTILDKPGRLNDKERRTVQAHPEFTYRILRRIGCFADIAEIAGSHHERMDGGGYWRGIGGEALSKSVRILVVSDICEALMADRPYRARLSRKEVLGIMGGMVGSGICPEAFGALEAFLEKSGFEPLPPSTCLVSPVS